jgi:hypothetical protein
MTTSVLEQKLYNKERLITYALIIDLMSEI